MSQYEVILEDVYSIAEYEARILANTAADQLMVNSIKVQLPPGAVPAEQINRVAAGLRLIIKQTKFLERLYLLWSDTPSTVLDYVPQCLTVFHSTMPVDAKVISFLNMQRNIRSLDLAQWGAHLPPTTRPPEQVIDDKSFAFITDKALPYLNDFSGHAQIAARIAYYRPIQTCKITTGIPSFSNPEQSKTFWSNIIGGVATSTVVVQYLAVIGVRGFGLEFLGAVQKYLPNLLSLRVGAVRYNEIDVFRFKYWKNELRKMSELRTIKLDCMEEPIAVWRDPNPTPTHTDLKALRKGCPALHRVQVSLTNRQFNSKGLIGDMEFAAGCWNDHVNQYSFEQTN